MAKKRLVAANWKMYVESLNEAKEFARTLKRKARSYSGIEILLAPSYTFLSELADILESSPVKVGAQALSPNTEPAHTGEVSARMLKEAGASFVLVGHSERRAMGETNDMVGAELLRAAEAGLTPVLCVGEREREQDGEHFAFIEAQLSSALAGVPKPLLKKLVVAYEPVWAIGKSAFEAMKPAELEQMVIFVRKILTDILDRRHAERVPILYGGSVEPSNAHELMEESGVNGFLVGHASAQIDSFTEILKAVQQDSR